jgi:hypothetical protein
LLTVINRPLGHRLTDAELDASVTDSSGEALFTTSFSHGLVAGDYVYVLSNFEAYNGYKYVYSPTYNTFKLRDSVDGDIVPYYQDGDVVYRISVLQHGWSAVNQPIVYELESDLFPNNIDEEAYTPNIVISQADAEGYTLLNLSAALSDPTELSWIELVGSGSLAGPYQIITVLQPWQIIINLDYDASNSFGGYQIVKYYKNYCIKVEVWSGVGAEHPWFAEKPFELAAVLQYVPDENGRAKFSIAEILRGYINTRNNLTLNTLPNNLDFMTAFYIVYFESYDTSDGSEITTFEGDPTQDTFEGHAVNASMPFKSLYQSFMSLYVNEDVYLAQWLCIQDQPVTIVGYFFDLSFINSLLGVDIQIIENGVLSQTIVNPGVGVIRVPFDFLAAGEYCIQAITSGTAEIPGVTSSITLPALALGANQGIGTSWTTGANPSVSLTATAPLEAEQSKQWVQSYAFIYGYTYEFTPDIDYVNDSLCFIRFQILDASDNILIEESESLSAGAGSETTPISFVAPFGAVKYAYFFEFINGIGTNTNTVDIDSITATQTTPTIPAVDAQDITEVICVTVLEECDDTIIADDNIRLLEDGDFRILE